MLEIRRIHGFALPKIMFVRAVATDIQHIHKKRKKEEVFVTF